MPSQFFGLYIAGSGLRASNAALNTTANNISNAQTIGYSRQQVVQQANNALRTFTTYGCAGAGVDTIAIERVRDSFYDVKYWNNNSKYGEYAVKEYYMKTIEEYFDDDNVSGFKTIFNKFAASLQSITTNSSSDSSKAQFIASAKSLTDYFNNMYGNLQKLQQDINLEIKQNVDQINSLAQKIATLNKQINVIELSGTTANELRDQRELLIDELSEIVDVDVTEVPITDPNDPDRVTGGTRYLVRIAGGQVLTDGNDYNTLTYVARDKDQKVNQTDADGLYKIMWANGNEFSLANASMDGRLKGLAQLRDGNNGANFNGTATSVSADGLTVKIEVTDEYLKNMRECTLSDTGGSITIGNTVYYYDSWKFNKDDTTTPPTYTYEFTMDPNTPVDPAKAGTEARTEAKIKYQGIPYYMEQMNAWIRQFSEAINNIFTSGYNANNELGENLFTGFSGNGTEYTMADFTDADGYYELTAGNFSINSKLLKDASLLGTRSSAEVGVEEFGQVNKVIELLASRDKFNFRNGTAGQLLESILSDISLNTSDAITFCEVFNGLRNSIDNQRISISGVDEDEEAVSLVKFQNAYTLASKMIQTLTEVYDQLILRTGV